MHSALSHPQLQIFAQPTVVIVSGWGGSGKTQTIGRALQGLSRNISEVGVIINERNQGSVDIDLARLPAGFEKLGLHGCACCSQLADVLSGIETFARQGRRLTFIEQSPLSITSDLRSGLRQRGYESIVAYVFNPGQFTNAPATHVQGIRDADVVLITHHDNGSPAAEKAKRIIKAAREELTPVQAIVDNGPNRPLPSQMWQSMLDIRQPPKEGRLRALAGLFSSRPRTSTDFTEERATLLRNYSEITVRPYATSPEAILTGVRALSEKGIILSRVKGSLTVGIGIDVIQEGKGHVLQQTGATETGGYLSLRSFEVQLSRYAGEIAAHLGTVDSSPNFVEQVVSGYPKEADLMKAVTSGNVPLGFESDRYLAELRVILPSIKHISDPTRREELAKAFVSALKASIETRLALVSVLQRCSVEPQKKSFGLFNAHYVLTDVLCDPNLQPLAAHPAMAPLFRAIRGLNPASHLISTVTEIPKIRFAGRNDLTRDELKLFVRALNLACQHGYVSQSAITSAYSKLERISDPAFQMHRGVLRS